MQFLHTCLMGKVAYRQEIVDIHPKPPPGHGFIDLDGVVFNRLTVVGYAGAKHGAALWWCECSCGTKYLRIVGASLRRGITQSCGCYRLDLIPLGWKHGQSRKGLASPEVIAYYSARNRCNEANPYYGGRGIKFLFESFEQFYTEVGPKPSPRHSLDRFPDNNGNYEPGNVRWATQEEQMNNRRNNRWITYADETLTALQWSLRLGMGRSGVTNRLKRGWCDTCAVSLIRRKRCSHRNFIGEKNEKTAT
jgi:hypothetical protein